MYKDIISQRLQHSNLKLITIHRDPLCRVSVSSVFKVVKQRRHQGSCPQHVHLAHEVLTNWGRVTHICVSRLTITGSDNGLSPDRRQAIIWTNAGILFIGPLGTHFSENSIEMLTFSYTKVRLKVSSAKWRPFCLGLNVLNACHSCHWGSLS